MDWMQTRMLCNSSSLLEKNWGKTQTPKLKNLNADNLLHTCVGVQLGKFIGVV